MSLGVWLMEHDCLKTNKKPISRKKTKEENLHSWKARSGHKLGQTPAEEHVEADRHDQGPGPATASSSSPSGPVTGGTSRSAELGQNTVFMFFLLTLRTKRVLGRNLADRVGGPVGSASLGDMFSMVTGLTLPGTPHAGLFLFPEGDWISRVAETWQRPL